MNLLLRLPIYVQTQRVLLPGARRTGKYDCAPARARHTVFSRISSLATNLHEWSGLVAQLNEVVVCLALKYPYPDRAVSTRAHYNPTRSSSVKSLADVAASLRVPVSVPVSSPLMT